uniref:Uncharacterized protein LOC101502020 isoform X2 n=1 Tax=Cicer arietinum TaxID=3827 RepID=A0A3Q7XZH8_CICAR|nr:uncharacterized protein LOC101502020 isoform X2 [Cicer arietinum]
MADFGTQRKITITNYHEEKLVGILHDASSTSLVIVCHGFQSNKERIPMVNLAAALEKEGISAFRFDFAGNGESEGSFQYGNYYREVEDLRAVVQHFREEKYVITTIVGHSKGKIMYRVTEESLMDRLNTITHLACLSIPENCRTLTVHGSMDETVSAEDALEFAKFISNHELHIIEGADHEYSCHQDELTSLVLEFIKVHNDKANNTSKQTRFGRVNKPIHSRF